MNSLTGRTALAFAALGAVIVVVMSVVVYRSSVDQRASRLRALAVAQAHSAATIYGATGALVDGATVNDPSAPAALRRAVDSGEAGSVVIDAHGQLVVWGAAPVGSNSVRGVFVRSSATEDLRALHSLRTTLILTSLIIIGVAAIGGIGVAARLSQRLRRAADAARAIAAGALDTRIGESGPDEVGALSGAVDAMADTLQGRIQRERQFSADVAHELRTPVTGLLAAAALLPAQDEVADMIRDRAGRLHRLVEDLLEISRLEAGHEVADLRPLDARVFAEDVAARYEGVSVTGTLTVETDPRRLERVLTNLLENAVHHGAPPIRITLSDREISVSDAGPGFPGAQTEALLERHVTRLDRGHGLGLAIAYEQARVLGAHLNLENPPGGGARATVRWPE